MTSRPKVVCLTPVKNESWILPLALSTYSLWADQIIVADQYSTDNSREIAGSFDKVILINNPNTEFNEPERQKLLIDSARSLPSPCVFVALDADEILSANVLQSSQWEEALCQQPGTIIEFPRINLWESIDKYFYVTYHPIGYVDDGHVHQGNKIHSVRIPMPDDAPRYRLEDVVVLHLQFCDLPRMRSKHRWYRCFERIQFPVKSSESINHLYSWMDRVEKNLKPSKPEWFQAYRELEINLEFQEDLEDYWWDWEVLRMFKTHGTELFGDLDIWEVDWERIRCRGLRMGIKGIPDGPIILPRKHV